MTLFPDCLDFPSGSAILLPIKPKFADLIIAGSKQVELRRSVPAQPVRSIVIYSSSPVQSIVAIADVKEIIEASPTKLWALAQKNGGGLTRVELFSYFEAKKTGYAMMLENIRVFDKPVNPTKVFKSFTPPQSFKYLTTKELQKLETLL